MHRQTRGLLSLAGAVVLAATVAAQQAAPPAQTPAARPRLSAPVRGVAQLAYTKPVIKNAKIDGRDFIVTTFQIKNLEKGSIAGLRIEEFWYDRAGDPVTGDDFRHLKPLQPGEIITVTLETPRNPRMDRNSYKFTHANGEIKPVMQARL
jgi:hypothetical protein